MPACDAPTAVASNLGCTTFVTTFAVHRLTEWYRQGADVQRLVYHLSVYLGHDRLAHTQVYLTMTPELLQQAGTLFERYARGEGSHA